MPVTDAPTGRRPADLVRRLRAWAGDPGSARRVLVRNGIWETTSFGIGAVVMFFLSPFIVLRLGGSLYGIWEMVVSLTGLLSFADIGVRPAAVHFISRYGARRDTDAVNGFVNTAFLTFSAAGALILVVAVPLAYVLPRFWSLAPGFETEATVALLVVAGEMGLALPLNAFSAVLVGKQRYDLLGGTRLAMLGVRAVLIVFVLTRGWGLVALAVVVAVTRLVQMAVYTWTAYRIEPTLRFEPRRANRDAFRRLLKFGGWATAVIVGLQVCWATDALVIGRALSDVHVAYFAVGFKLAFYARELPRVAARVVEPATGALHGLGDSEAIRRLLANSVRTVLLLSGPILVYLLVVGEPFLRQWMSAEYALRSAGVLTIMTLAVLPAIAAAPLAAVYYGTNRVRQLALLIALEAVLNLGLSIALVGRYGIEGVAVGTAVPAWLVHAFLLPALLCRPYGIRWPRFMMGTWVGPLAAGACAFLVLGRFVSPGASYGWPALIGLALLTLLLYYGAVLVLRRLAPPLFGGGVRPEPAREEKDA